MKTFGFSSITAVLVFVGASSSAAGQPANHGFHPPMPGQQYYFQCQLDQGPEPLAVEVPLELASLSNASDLEQEITLPEPLHSIRLTRYLPRAVLEQTVEAEDGPGGHPAVHMSIDGPAQSYQRWLIAGDSRRNRLTSFIGTWRFMAVANAQQRDELFDQFKNELTRDPVLRIGPRDGGEMQEVPAKAGTTQSLSKLDCIVRVQRFYPHFAMDKKKGEPINQSDQRVNPAALVEVEQNGKKKQRWVFAKFPDFSTDDSADLPFRITLDCPTGSQGSNPDFLLVSMDRSKREAWMRHRGEVTTRSLKPDERIEIAGSQYTFSALQFVPSARLVESYAPTKDKGGVPALRIETTDQSGAQTSLWLELNKLRVIPTASGPLSVQFGLRQENISEAHQ